MSSVNNASQSITSDGSIPPNYSEYPTELPPTFPIGKLEVQPLVSVTDLQAHLRILGAFAKLQSKVQQLSSRILRPEEAWVIFVNRAVDRFYRLLGGAWPEGLLPASTEATMPPLDVLLVWHSYLLNPRHYYEDAHRKNTTYHTNLRALSAMPITLVAAGIDPKTLEPYPPSPDRQQWFEEVTGVSYEPPYFTSEQETFETLCPCCDGRISDIRWWRESGGGYAQPKFERWCPYCFKQWNRKYAGMRKFCDEIARRLAGEKIYFSETLLEPYTGVIEYEKAEKLCGALTASFSEMGRPKNGADIGRKISWDQAELKKHLTSGAMARDLIANSRSPRLYRILLAYADSGLASVELVGAVLRQGDFIKKMVNMQWTAPGRFEEPSTHAPLVRCIARYHAFLWMMSAHPGLLLVPTLDIDLAWHTHQLNAATYRHDTMTVIGRTPNHEDSIAQDTLSTSFDMTAKAWREAFGVPYSVCGCFPDDRKPVGTLTRLKSVFDKSKDHPALQNPRPDLISIELEDANASHASEHNAALQDPQGARTGKNLGMMKTKVLHRVKDARGLCKSSRTYDPWTALQIERHDNNQQKKDKHEFAFTDRSGLGYYPYWGISMYPPVGFYGGAGYDGTAVCGGGCGGGCRGGGDADGGGGGCGGGGCGGGGGGGGGGCGGGGGGGGGGCGGGS